MLPTCTVPVLKYMKIYLKSLLENPNHTLLISSSFLKFAIDKLKKRMKNSQKLDEKYFKAKYFTFCLIWKQRQVSQQPPPQSSMGYCKIFCRVFKAVSHTTCNAIVTMNKTAVIMKERNTSF